MDNGYLRNEGPATQARGSLPEHDRPSYRRTAYSEHDGGRPGAGTAFALVAAGALTATAIGVATKRRHQDERPEDDAPRRAALRHRIGDYALVGRTVTIKKPRNELYAFFRDFSNLPSFMENLEAIEPVSGSPKDRRIWKIAAPAGRTVNVETDVAEDVKNEKIAWRSTENSDIDTSGHVLFRDAPQNRGTEVELVIAYEPPLGTPGRAVAKLFQREPHIQARRDLKRFKMLMETGEITTSSNRRDL